MIYSSQEELEAGLAKWQKLLRLQNWDVSIRFKEMEDSNGKCNYWVRKQSAVIYIMPPEAYTEGNDFRERPQDMEKDLVHELLHLHFAKIEPEWDEKHPHPYDEFERTVEVLACQFALLDRR